MRTLLIMVLALGLSACGQKEETVSYQDSEGNTQSLEVVDDGGTRTVKSADGAMTATGTQDENKARFPSYAPRYAGSKVLSVVDMDMGGTKRQMIVQRSTDSAEAVVAFYRSEFKKAGIEVSEMDSGTGGIMMSEGALTNPRVQVVVTGTADGADINHSVPID